MDAMLNIIDMGKTEIDYDKIREKYDFFLIKNESKGGYKPNSRIFDDALIKKNVLAIQYTGGPAFIVMMKHDKQNENNIISIIKDYNEECNGGLTKEELSVPFEKAPHAMILVMFNALAKSAKHADVLNLGGKLYYFTNKAKSQVYCIELKIDKDYIITLSSRTFTIDKKPLGKPEYVLQKNNTMRRRNRDDKEGPFYTISQFSGKKHETPFLDVSGKFESTKIGVLTKLLEKFNKEYEGLVKLVIKRETDWTKIDIKSSASLKKEHLRNLKSLLNGRTIRIINNIDDEYSEIAKQLCLNIKNVIEDIFQSKEIFLKGDQNLNFKIKIADKVGKSDLNICLNHCKKFCETHPEIKDTYKKSNEVVIQNITLEDFSKGKSMIEATPAACVVLLNELIVKDNLPKPNCSTGKITIFDWSKIQYKSDWTFCWCEIEWKDNGPNQKKTPINHIFFMIIHPDGSFEIGEKSRDLFNQEEFDKLEDIFNMNNMTMERHNKSNEKYKGLVMNDKGEINIIQDTSLIMYPDLEKIKEAVREGLQTRNNEVRDSYFLGCLDIYYKEQKDFALYSVNQIGGGMNTSVQRAANIRRVLPHGDGPVFFKELLNTMNVTFVRNGQLTVLPFPFKYLREFIDTLDGSL